MIVCLAGPSGSGKTTLAKALALHFGWDFRENSAGLIISRDHKEHLNKEYNYQGDWGQVKVINESHKNPEFGLYFQQSIMAARKAILISQQSTGKSAVYDRGPLDPIVFYLNQVVHNLSESYAENIITEATGLLRYVDLIIRVPLQNPSMEIEDNGSRVANWYFQAKIDMMYDLAINLVQQAAKTNPLIFTKHPTHVMRTTTWDWEVRLKECIQKIESLDRKQYMGKLL